MLHRPMRPNGSNSVSQKPTVFLRLEFLPDHNPLFGALRVSFTRRRKQSIVFALNKVVNETTVPKLDKTTEKVVGYARVSTSDQELDLQLDSLRDHGCTDENIFTDKVSGAKSECPGLQKWLASLSSGDVLIVWRLDRLGSSMSHFVSIIEAPKKNSLVNRIGGRYRALVASRAHDIAQSQESDGRRTLRFEPNPKSGRKKSSIGRLAFMRLARQ